MSIHFLSTQILGNFYIVLRSLFRLSTWLEVTRLASRVMGYIRLGSRIIFLVIQAIPGLVTVDNWSEQTGWLRTSDPRTWMPDVRTTDRFLPILNGSRKLDGRGIRTMMSTKANSINGGRSRWWEKTPGRLFSSVSPFIRWIPSDCVEILYRTKVPQSSQAKRVNLVGNRR